jgi:hypothetical protein
MMPGDFPADHPVDEVGRLLTALLIKHLGLGFQVIALIDQGKGDSKAVKLRSAHILLLSLTYCLRILKISPV